MRVSYNWLKEYVDIPVGPQELAAKMTMAGVAVENIEFPGEGFEKVVTARLTNIRRHPNADKLVICTALTGSEELQIVTGAPNVADGQVVALALSGAVLPGGKIKEGKLRGELSQGMLCSGQELGMDSDLLPADQKEGILVFPEDTPLGVDVKKVLGLDDTILELELTPNRADCLSMLGVAREVAAVLGTKLRAPVVEVPETDEDIYGKVEVEIAEPELCSRYTARLIRNVKVGPSPLWMQCRLRACGIRPISNIVDVTNYILMEYGQPLHAFDAAKLSPEKIKILVRRAGDGEKMNSLDGVERELDRSMLVITDGKHPVAVAGVMGGLESEVSEETNSVLLESAQFTGSNIMRTSKRLGLRSESSLRFEKGVDRTGCVEAINRAAQLIQEMGAGTVTRGVVDEYPVPYKPVEIKLRAQRVNDIMGVEIAASEVEEILKNLNFTFRETGDGWMVDAPSRRGDIEMEIDLIEEVARLYGYNRIPTTLAASAAQGRRTTEQAFVSEVRETMISLGLAEAINMSFIHPKLIEQANIPADSPLNNGVLVANPLSEDQRFMRTTLLPGLLEVLRKNTTQRTKDIAVFEIGNRFLPRQGEALPQELPTLAAAVMGRWERGWAGQPEQLDFYFLKGVIEMLAGRLGLRDLAWEREEDNPVFHPGRCARLVAGGQSIGVIGEAHPVVQENFRLPDKACLVELNLTAAMEAAGPRIDYKPIPKFPPVERDLALLVKEETPASQLRSVITEAGGKLLADVRLFDVYQGSQVQQGMKSLAFALRFQAPDRTLTDEEVNAVFDKITAALSLKLGAVLRG